MCCAVQQHTPHYSRPLIKATHTLSRLARCRAPSLASATEKSRAAVVVHPACPKLGLVVSGTSIDRWRASRKAGRAAMMAMLRWCCYTSFAFLLRPRARLRHRYDFDRTYRISLADPWFTGGRSQRAKWHVFCVLLSCCLSREAGRPYHRSRPRCPRCLRLRAISRNLERLGARADRRHYSITGRTLEAPVWRYFRNFPAPKASRSRWSARDPPEGRGIHTAQA